MGSQQTLSASEPIFFSSHNRPLYGVYCPAVTKTDRSLGLIACHSIGIEQAVPSNMLARIVRRAGELGCPALLFHARGHGDSGGDFADVSFETLVEDAEAAAAYLRDRAGVQKIAWLGVRFGGLVAAHCAAKQPDSPGLALWEPVHKGIDYFRQLLRGLLFAASARGGRSGVTVDQLLAQIEREGRVDMNATYIHAKLLLSARGVDLSKILDKWRSPTLLAQVQPRMNLSPDNSNLINRLQQSGASIEVAQIKDEPGWQFWRPSWGAPSLIDQTGAWLNALA